MGLGSFLFGSSGGYPGWYKQQSRGLFDQYMNALQGAFGSQAHNLRVGQYREGLDRQMANSEMLGNRSLGSRGFRGSGGLMDLSKAKSVTDFDIRDWLGSQQGLMSGLAGGSNLLQAAGQANYKKPTSGLFQQGLSLAGSALSGGMFGGMFGGVGGGMGGDSWKAYTNDGYGFGGLAEGWMPIEEQNPFKVANPLAQQDMFGNYLG